MRTKQEEINFYYNKLYKDKLLEFDNGMIGKVKNDIESLNREIKQAKELMIKDKEYYIGCYNDIMEDLKNKNENDIVELFIHPMTGYYMVLNKDTVLRRLKREYKLYEEENEKL